MSEWTDKFKAALDLKTVAIALIVLTYVGEKVWGYIQVGVNTEFQADVAKTFTGDAFYNAVDSVFTVKVTDPATLARILESETIADFSEEAGAKIRNTIIEDVMKKDTNKISMRSFIGMKTGMRDEDVLPELADLLDAWQKGELMTKKEADAHIKKALRVAKF
jgi:hypothetical protein